MGLSDRERLVAVISNGIAVFSLLQERQELPPDTTMYGFVLKAVPKDLRPKLSAGLIDQVFESVTSAHSS